MLTPQMNCRHAVGVIALLPTLAVAQSSSLADLIKSATVPMPMSTSPASFLLGNSGENVPRLTSFRDFTTQVSRAYDDKGKLATAVAAEVAPGLAMGTMTWSDIVNSPAQRIWSRTMVSFASKVGTDKEGPQTSVGVQSIFWAPAMDDALASFPKTCMDISKSVSEIPPVIDPATGKPKPVDIAAETKKAAEACQKKIDGKLTKWNQPMVAAGAGRTFASTPEAGKPAAKDRSSYWLTAAYGADFAYKDEAPLETRNGFLLTAHFRATTKVPVTASNGTSAEAKQRLQGVNIRVGNAVLAGILEYSTTSSRASGFAFVDRKRGVLGLEYKPFVKEDVYFTLGVARDTGLPAAQQQLLAKLHWGFGKSPTLLAK
ncbi:hypothetical protein [Pelomonas sp. SE-A7]|uniref:hypothetical protein n=1 Tax=Pelomonas sp. SE-A7 TaxID=3054953 RepID=UPI00259CF674|nr:hypothetical protein [Pelomonas sp. SE-A7]MDM4765268.1 hypothetical protein [Pelomonas sp. SE-A7]